MNRPTHPQLVAALVKPPLEILMTLDYVNVDLWHAATGIAGEGGELLEAFTIPVGQKLDLENVIEELGDLEFYMEQLRSRLDLDRDNSAFEFTGAQANAAPVLVAIRAAAILDLVKKVALYNKPVDRPGIAAALRELDEAMAMVRLCCDLTREQTLEGNIDKLSVRYGTSYSDAAAQARVDKQVAA